MTTFGNHPTRNSRKSYTMHAKPKKQQHTNIISEYDLIYALMDLWNIPRNDVQALIYALEDGEYLAKTNLNKKQVEQLHIAASRIAANSQQGA